MSTEWIHNKRKGWPEGSLERHLMLRGAKSLVEAVKQQVKDNLELKEFKNKLEETKEKKRSDNGKDDGDRGT